VDMEKAAEEDEKIGLVKTEDGAGEDGGLGQLATLLTAEDQQKVLEDRKAAAPKADVVQAILSAAGVEYTHDNSEVIATSKIEETLSRRAAMASFSEEDVQAQETRLFSNAKSRGLHSIFNPPEDVQKRQFCEMAREFGFANATDFALVVEGWTQENRTNCLDLFYKRRQAKLDSNERAPPSVKKQEKDDPLKEEIDIKYKNDGDEKKWKPEVSDENQHKAKVEKMDDEVVGSPAVKRETKHEMGDVKLENKRLSIFLSDDDDDEL
jgi:hypothetical protein